MTSRSTSRFGTVLATIVAAVMLAPAILPLAAWAAPVPRPELIEPYLMRMMDAGATSLDVIVQFRSAVRDEDLQMVRDCGLSVEHRFGVLPAIRAVGPADAVERLSGNERVLWIEYNAPLTYMMDRSLLTVNATRTWDTRVMEKGGTLDPGIDGTGITVVVVDSGIDAGHPDLDYGTKTIMNLKSDSNLVWTEVENSDTSSGHGTHVAGTIAGTGGASGGARAGVARGARLIGLSTGEAVAILNALGAFEWAYEHSRPGNNPYNIRVVSNSWGTTTEYDPQDSIVQMTQKLTYENNVVVTFAAGNEGSSDHDGATRTTNPYSLTPGAISVAATERDGSGIATFSSRGLASDNFTWPDIAAPGVKIVSTQARRTLITAETARSDNDLYYMAISGTSMATPHMSGAVAMLWQACPGLRVSELHDDFSGKGQYDNASYWNDSGTLMHEAELVLKLTADYIDPTPDNLVPANSSIGLGRLRHDFAQGYGLIDLYKAVALALTLERLRAADPNITVLQAWSAYNGVMTCRTVSSPTDTLKASWKGVWARFDGSNGSIVFTNQMRDLYIPAGASRLVLEMQYVAVNLDERYLGTLGLRVDTNGDGRPEFTGSSTPTVTGTRREQIPVQASGGYMGVDVFGQGFGLNFKPSILPGTANRQYWEIQIHYAVTAVLVFDTPPNANATIDHLDYMPRVVPWAFGTPTADYHGGNLSMVKHFYDMGKAVLPRPHGPPAPERPPLQWWLLGVLAIVFAAGLGWRELKRRGLDRKYLDPSGLFRRRKR